MGDIVLVSQRIVAEISRPQWVMILQPAATIVQGGPGGATAMADLTDVDLTDLQVGDVPKWDGTKFVNAPDASGGAPDWATVQNKPTEFPPSAHNHTAGEITDFDDAVAASPAVAANTAKVSNATHTGDVVGDVALTIADRAVTLIKMQDIQPGRILGHQNAGVGPIEQLTPTQARTILNVADGATANASDASLRDRSTHTGTQAIATVTGLQTALDGKQATLGFTPEDAAQKGVAGGYAGLDGTGKVPAAQLPAYVDDVVEAANFAALPGTGESGKIYVTLDNNKTWRWSGSAYVEISPSPGSTDSVTEGATNLYFTTARVLATALTGYAAAGARTALASTDTILGSMGKIGKYLADLAAVAFSGSASDLSTGTLPTARIADGSLGLAKLANIATARFLGRSTAGSGVPEEMTGTLATALLDAFTTTLKGLVPAPGSATGKFLRDDGTWAAPAGGGGIGPDKFVYFNDFYTTVADQVCVVAVANATAGLVAWPFGGDPSGSGFLRMATTATISTARASWGSANISTALYLRQGVAKFRTRGAIMTLSDATVSYQCFAGFVNDVTASPTQGCYFRYNHAVNGGRWEAVTVAGGSPTVVDTGVAAVAGAMAILEIEVNAAGTSVIYKIDGVTVATITTTIPAANTNLGFDVGFRKISGSTAVNVVLWDYIMLDQEFTGR